MFRTTQFLLVATIVFAVCATTQAASIPLLIDNTTGMVILDDNFETGTVGQSPSTSTPAVGAWTYIAVTGTPPGSSTMTIENLANSGIAAFEGDKYLRMQEVRPESGAAAYCYMSAETWNDTAGHQMTATFAWRPQAGGYMAQMRALYGGDIAGGTIGLWGDGRVSLLNAAGTEWSDYQAAATPDEWNTIVVQHTNGTDEWSVSVNGSPFETLKGGNTGYWNGLQFASGGDGVYCFDAVPAAAPEVPEPSTLALLGIAMLGFAACAWKRRK